MRLGCQSHLHNYTAGIHSSSVDLAMSRADFTEFGGLTAWKATASATTFSDRQTVTGEASN